MIPTKPPPTFKNPADWSSEFISFVSQCLIKNPEERKSATELLEVADIGHSFTIISIIISIFNILECSVFVIIFSAFFHNKCPISCNFKGDD